MSPLGTETAPAQGGLAATIAAAIFSRAESMGFSERTLSKASGLSATYLRDRKRNVKALTLSDVETLAKVLGITSPTAFMSKAVRDAGR